jgi:hypothetical protein
MGSDHNEACIVLISGVDDGLPGGGSLDRQRICAESGRISQLDAARSRLLGGFADIIGACRVEVRVRL